MYQTVYFEPEKSTIDGEEDRFVTRNQFSSATRPEICFETFSNLYPDFSV